MEMGQIKTGDMATVIGIFEENLKKSNQKQLILVLTRIKPEDLLNIK